MQISLWLFHLNWTGPYHGHLLPLVNHSRITWKPLNKWHLGIWWVEMYIDTSICDAFVCTLVVPFVVGGGNISSKVGHKNDIKAVALPIKSSAQREIKCWPTSYIHTDFMTCASLWITKCNWMNIEKPLNETVRKINRIYSMILSDWKACRKVLHTKSYH